MIQLPSQRWDIFCKIVDNFGDIGVCWRLSQQLANEHHRQVRLFIDDFYIASKIIPQFDTARQEQTINNVKILAWSSLNISMPDVVVENFSCGLPEPYTQQMLTQKKSAKPIIWINLEYLSAEKWVEDCHALPSTHPTSGLKKTFFYPGFTEKTGGLLREHHLMTTRDAFLNSPAEQAQFWQQFISLSKMRGPVLQNFAESIKISLFSYPEANIQQFIRQLVATEKTIHIFLPFNSEITALNGLIEKYHLKIGEAKALHRVRLHLLPFLSQSQYDQLLWACDLNFVRGEDSWIRAIWAGKPFVWQPYIQAENTHLTKLAAFLSTYLLQANQETKELIESAHLVWSNAMPIPDEKFWLSIKKNLPIWQAYTQQKSQLLTQQKSLSQALVDFCAPSNF
jgi:uncharacterized repeat protein (TIGR03837 family)